MVLHISSKFPLSVFADDIKVPLTPLVSFEWNFFFYFHRNVKTTRVGRCARVVNNFFLDEILWFCVISLFKNWWSGNWLLTLSACTPFPPLKSQLFDCKYKQTNGNKGLLWLFFLATAALCCKHWKRLKDWIAV